MYNNLIHSELTTIIGLLLLLNLKSAIIQQCLIFCLPERPVTIMLLGYPLIIA